MEWKISTKPLWAGQGCLGRTSGEGETRRVRQRGGKKGDISQQYKGEVERNLKKGRS